MSEPLEILGVSHHYGKVPVLDSVDLTVRAGEIVAVLGASGCGKTTLLRAVAGLVTPAGGELRIGGVSVAKDGRERVPVEARGVGLVFQEYALFQHMSVRDNVGFGLRDRDPERVASLLSLAGLDGLGGRRPSQLSGGQQQRVALIRALAPRPHLMLLDEPFANVDAERRHALGLELRQVIRAEGAAALLVTHDRSDALRLSDRVVVLTPGERGAIVSQEGRPEKLYRYPCSEAVARLTGPVSFLEGVARGDLVETVLGELALVEPREGPVRVMFRPEQLGLEAGTDHEVVDAAFVGRSWLLRCRVGEGELELESAERATAGRVVVKGPVHALGGG